MASQNQIVLITGGSRGLGKNMAVNLAKKGLNVILTYNTKKDEALAVVSEIESLGRKAVALQLNVTDSKSFDAFFANVSDTLKNTFGATHINYLVNNAGTGTYAMFADTTEEQLDEMINIHFKATFLLSQKALAWLADGGGIVNLSTGLARFATPGYAAYAAMKGGIETLTRYMARELGPRGIRVNAVAPGAIETDFAGGVVRDNPHVNAHLASVTAMGRVGLPDDIGGIVAFLCTEDARWITAQRIEASGGMFL